MNARYIQWEAWRLADLCRDMPSCSVCVLAPVCNGVAADGERAGADEEYWVRKMQDKILSADEEPYKDAYGDSDGRRV